MKKHLFFWIIMLLFDIFVSAQTPESFNYQAVIRDENGQILKNREVSLRITLLQDSARGSAVYTETFAVTTNDYGIVSLQVGTGDSSDDFSAVDWQEGPYFLSVAIDKDRGSDYVETGTFQLLSVPYALHAKTAENVFSGNYNDLDNKPDLSVYLTAAGESGIMPYWAGDDSLGLTNLFFQNGKTGIGVKNPSFTLDVAGTGRFSDSLLAGSLLQIGKQSAWQLSPRNDTLFLLHAAGGQGAGLMLESPSGNQSGLYINDNRQFSLLDNKNKPVWFTYNSPDYGGNIYLRDGHGYHSNLKNYGSIQFANGEFSINVPYDNQYIISFRRGYIPVSRINNEGILFSPEIMDMDNHHFTLNPDGASTLFDLSVEDTLTAATTVTSHLLDSDDPGYGIDPSGISRINTFHVNKILSNNTSSQNFVIDPTGISVFGMVNVRNTIRTNRIDAIDNPYYFLSPSHYSVVYDLTSEHLKSNFFTNNNKAVFYGFVSINTTETVVPYRLYVNGSAYSTSGWNSSDIRWKKDIVPLHNTLNKVLSLQGVKFYWRKKEYPEMGFDDREHIGLIAQQVEKVFPDLVNTDEKGYKAVSYEMLTAVLLEALKEQQKMIDDQQKHLKELEQKVEKLKK